MRMKGNKKNTKFEESKKAKNYIPARKTLATGKSADNNKKVTIRVSTKRNSLPKRGSIFIGNRRVSVPYIDSINDIVSLETVNLPIVPKQSRKSITNVVSKILKNTGFKALSEIGNDITDKL